MSFRMRMVRKRVGMTGALAAGAAVLAGAWPLFAQYPGQVQKKDKANPPMRSVVVVEWTGDIAKPKASRVIPISVWDGDELQDGSVYLARPEPLALDGGVEYELQQNGKNVGLFEITEAARQQTSWIGFGKWRALPTGPTPEELARMRASVKIDADDTESDKPVLHRKQHAEDGGGAGGADEGKKRSAPDPDRPTLHKSDDSEGGSEKTAGGAGPAPDPDRPRLHAESDAEKAKQQEKAAADASEGPVSSVPSAGDPDRPKLKRGIPEGLEKAVTPTLIGMPAEMNQEVGVSDARKMKEHPWDFSWADPDDARKMKEALEDEARKVLGLASSKPPEPPAAPKRAGTAARKKVVAPVAEPPAPAPLLDEQFRVFELSYGGGATMVFSAHSEGTGADEKFVTLVAQPDLYGSVITILKSVTDAAHLDVKPRMRLVDAVDAEGDNRGELLFEMRGQSQRQFALYRVFRGQATQIFETGSSWFGPGGE